MYRKTSQLTNRKGKKQSLHVRDKECDMLTDSDKLQLRSKQCIEELYGKNYKPMHEDMHLEADTEYEKGPPTLFRILKQ